MNLLLGPVLQFLGIQNKQWCISVLVTTATAAPPVLQSSAVFTPFTLLETLQSGASVWRGGLMVDLGSAPQRVRYSVDAAAFAVHVPADQAPPRMVYGSCNGFSSPGLMKGVKDKNALWTRLMNLHTGRERINGRSFGPYHVLLLGGDQVYSDALWQDSTCPDIVAWSQLTRDKRRKAAWTPALQTQVSAFFEGLYLTRWAQPEVATALASLPSVMMWDDHDIFDGWGSYPAEDHDCPVYQGVFAIAKKYFALFQRHSLAGQPPPCTLPGQGAFSAAYRVGHVGVLALDMRCERTPERQRGSRLQSAQVINQLTSSGIVHPPPPAMARYFLEKACLQVETVDRGITAAMYEFPTTSRRLIGARNFMTIEPDDAGNPAQRLWVNWWVENEAEPTSKVIHPVG